MVGFRTGDLWSRNRSLCQLGHNNSAIIAQILSSRIYFPAILIPNFEWHYSVKVAGRDSMTSPWWKREVLVVRSGRGKFQRATSRARSARRERRCTTRTRRSEATPRRTTSRRSLNAVRDGSWPPGCSGRTWWWSPGGSAPTRRTTGGRWEQSSEKLKGIWCRGLAFMDGGIRVVSLKFSPISLMPGESMTQEKRTKAGIEPINSQNRDNPAQPVVRLVFTPIWSLLIFILYTFSECNKSKQIVDPWAFLEIEWIKPSCLQSWANSAKN